MKNSTVGIQVYVLADFPPLEGSFVDENDQQFFIFIWRRIG